jgi:tripartite tricarboxylate transporter family receptor
MTFANFLAIRNLRFALPALLLAIAWGGAAWALYPERTIRIVVPFAPGGGTDVVARTLAQEMAKVLGVSVIIENKPGAGTIIGTQAVVASAADGYTLLMGTFSHAVNSSLSANLPYDPHRDFAPVAMIARSFNIVVVNPKSSIRSIADLIAAAKANPDRLTYGTFGVGTSAHLAGELFKDMAKVCAIQGRRAGSDRPDQRPDRCHVHDRRERSAAGRKRPAAWDRGDVGGALTRLSASADRFRSRRARLHGGELVRPVRAGRHPGRNHRPAQ